MDFSRFDTRHHPMVDVAIGYGEWARTYDEDVRDEMDLRLLSRLRSIEWSRADRVIDLACGTGRVGSWLRTNGVVDGTDGWKQPIPGKSQGFARVVDHRTQLEIRVPGAPRLVRDTVRIRSRILKEQQILTIVF